LASDEYYGIRLPVRWWYRLERRFPLCRCYPTANVFPCQIGDIIDVDGQFHSACTVGGSNDALTVEYAIYCCTTDSGGIAQYPTYVHIAIAPNNSLAYPIHLRGRYIAEVAGPLCVWIKCRFSVGGSGVVCPSWSYPIFRFNNSAKRSFKEIICLG